MEYHISMLLTSIVTISLLLLTTLPPSLSQQQLPNNYSLCSQKPYTCGILPDIYYPFWGQNRPRYCGGGDQFHLTCDSDHTYIQMPSQKFEVDYIDTKAHTLTTVPTEYNVCSPHFNFSLSPLFWYANTVLNITVFFDCPSEVSVGTVNNFTCQVNGSESHNGVYYMGVEDEVMEEHPELEICGRRMQVPEDMNAPSPDGGLHALYGAFRKGFQVNYVASQECERCLGSEGTCGSNDTGQFTCYCPDGSNGLNCSASVSHRKSNRLQWKRKIITGVIGTLVVSGLMLICITICCFRCKSSSRWQEIFWLKTNSNKDIEAFLKNQGALTLKRYKFSDVKKMTNSFKFKLGEGGFGVVYKGKLLTGCLVAVKILNPSKGNIDDFINEVASISKTSHVNVVTLLGFCLEGRRKALIYEFMSNGSLEKFIFKKGSQATPSLSWDDLYQIAIGIARGLEYLHRGCSTRILHFDIKPHNILLDDNFCPKISDFGLSKLCIKKESTISMSDARGTIGYIAPEVWNRHFGGVSHKSDVYSYGMMLLEIVAGRKNINAEASHTSEIYFPNWIYRRLEQGTHLGLDGELAIAENEVIKRMTIVGLWCIQTIPSDRPTMSRVVDMLEDSKNSLEMPPKPVLFSPVRSMAESSTNVDYLS